MLAATVAFGLVGAGGGEEVESYLVHCVSAGQIFSQHFLCHWVHRVSFLLLRDAGGGFVEVLANPFRDVATVLERATDRAEFFAAD